MDNNTKRLPKSLQNKERKQTTHKPNKIKLLRQGETIDVNKKLQKRRLLLQITLIAFCILLVLLALGGQTDSNGRTEEYLINMDDMTTTKINLASKQNAKSPELHKSRLQKLRMHNVLRDIPRLSTISRENASMLEPIDSAAVTHNYAGRNQSGHYQAIVKQWEHAFIYGEITP